MSLTISLTLSGSDTGSGTGNNGATVVGAGAVTDTR